MERFNCHNRIELNNALTELTIKGPEYILFEGECSSCKNFKYRVYHIERGGIAKLYIDRLIYEKNGELDVFYFKQFA